MELELGDLRSNVGVFRAVLSFSELRNVGVSLALKTGSDFSPHVYNNSDELVIVLNAVESTCAVEFYTVVDTSRSPVHNIPCPLHWVRDKSQYTFD